MQLKQKRVAKRQDVTEPHLVQQHFNNQNLASSLLLLTGSPSENESLRVGQHVKERTLQRDHLFRGQLADHDRPVSPCDIAKPIPSELFNCPDDQREARGQSRLWCHDNWRDGVPQQSPVVISSNLAAVNKQENSLKNKCKLPFC